MKYYKKLFQNGFTLIELLVVMAVIGGLATIGLVSFRSGSGKATDAQRKSDIKQFQVALEVYASKNSNKFPDHSGSIRDICPDLGLLNCPKNSLGDYYYQVDTSGYGYYIWAELAEKIDGVENQYFVTCSNGLVADVNTLPSGSICPISDITPTPTSSPLPTPTYTPPPSTNLIADPSFESGTASWDFFSNPSASGSWSVTSQAAVVQKSGSSNNMQLYQYGINLKPNTNYRLSFDAKKDSGSGFSVFIHKHPTPNTNYGLNGFSVTPTTTWTNYWTNFTSNSSAQGDARIRFWFSSSGNGRYYIDNVSLIEQ